jgi:hypothetical protein
MIRALATFSVSVWLLAGAAAGAQSLADKAREAEALADQGKFVEASDRLDQAAALLWQRAPLMFRRALWVATEPSAWGVYDPRADNVFAAGENMIAYAEPIGFGWQQAGDIWQLRMAADVVIKSKDGTELRRIDDFQELDVASRARNREIFTSFTFTFSGIPQGEYVVETILRDTLTGKSGSFSLPFVVR